MRRSRDADGRRDGCRALHGLAGEDPRLARSRLGEAAPVCAEVSAPAVGQREDVRRGAELLDDLERRGLLAFEAVRVERVDEHVRPAICKGTRGAKTVVEASAHLEHPSAERARLRELCGCDRAGRLENERLQPRARCVRRRRSCGVPRGGADDGMGTLLERSRDRDRHSPVLEASGRVRPLQLQVHLHS